MSADYGLPEPGIVSNIVCLDGSISVSNIGGDVISVSGTLLIGSATYTWSAVPAGYATLNFANAAVTVMIAPTAGITMANNEAPQITTVGTYQLFTSGQFTVSDGTVRFFELYDNGPSGLDSSGSDPTAGTSQFPGIPSFGVVVAPTNFAVDVEHDAAAPSDVIIIISLVKI